MEAWKERKNNGQNVSHSMLRVFFSLFGVKVQKPAVGIPWAARDGVSTILDRSGDCSPDSECCACLAPRKTIKVIQAAVVPIERHLVGRDQHILVVYLVLCLVCLVCFVWVWW